MAIKKTFGRVVERPDIHDGQPYVKKKSGKLKVAFILDLIDKGVADSHIHQCIRDIEQDDIHASRAWQARFQPDALAEKFSFDPAQNVFLVDENTSYLALYDIVRIFGKSSHVAAEDLCNSDDEKEIWAHAIAHKYQAVLTSDKDFCRISRRYRAEMIEKYGSLENCPEHVPAVIFSKTNIRIEKIPEILEANMKEITRYIEDNDAIYLSVSTDGCNKLFPDSDDLPPPSPRIGPSSPPLINPEP